MFSGLPFAALIRRHPAHALAARGFWRIVVPAFFELILTLFQPLSRTLAVFRLGIIVPSALFDLILPVFVLLFALQSMDAGGQVFSMYALMGPAADNMADALVDRPVIIGFCRLGGLFFPGLFGACARASNILARMTTGRVFGLLLIRIVVGPQFKDLKEYQCQN
ncbi:MAG: hypothetical protein HZA50_00375 [Planctomycetes bacterium]|nr:hypothetical protein [Planctomycetota bacterium]